MRLLVLRGGKRGRAHACLFWGGERGAASPIRSSSFPLRRQCETGASGALGRAQWPLEWAVCPSLCGLRSSPQSEGSCRAFDAPACPARDSSLVPAPKGFVCACTQNGRWGRICVRVCKPRAGIPPLSRREGETNPSGARGVVAGMPLPFLFVSLCPGCVSGSVYVQRRRSRFAPRWSRGPLQQELGGFWEWYKKPPVGGQEQGVLPGSSST
ncbi:uncharacterized protein LOC119566085 [Chelonia mydas]|uniref:uncharacterized protein LOC119566085 n=1 Tax=Chelonia mydas TaxID=8469 RepID=UPI001CA8763C|nr:uncharacterized protein LOC119566085 [Chelonia mydas]